MRDAAISPGLSFDPSILGPQPGGGSCTTAQTPCVLNKVIRTCLPVTIDAVLWCSFSSGMHCREIELMRIISVHHSRRGTAPLRYRSNHT
ncbi:hypothetical protein OG21DRAFT_1503680 [Imleria badia]|nr:hypothetical protein OG21DRAFT_1503680 [Imleria badia]